MLGGPTMNLLIAIVLYAIVLCLFGVPQNSTTIGSVSECVVPASSTQTECTDDDQPAPAFAAGLKPGDRFVSIDGVHIDSADEVGEIIRRSAGETIEVVIDRDGDEQTVELTPIVNELAVRNSLGQVGHRSRRQSGDASRSDSSASAT